MEYDPELKDWVKTPSDHRRDGTLVVLAILGLIAAVFVIKAAFSAFQAAPQAAENMRKEQEIDRRTKEDSAAIQEKLKEIKGSSLTDAEIANVWKTRAMIRVSYNLVLDAKSPSETEVRINTFFEGTYEGKRRANVPGYDLQMPLECVSKGTLEAALWDYLARN